LHRVEGTDAEHVQNLLYGGGAIQSKKENLSRQKPKQV
jgi:hypothetical protein